MISHWLDSTRSQPPDLPHTSRALPIATPRPVSRKEVRQVGMDRVIVSGNLGGVVVCTDPSGEEPHRQVGMDRVIASGNVGGVVVCTDPSGEEPHRQVGMDRVIASGNLGGVVVCTDLSGKEPYRQLGDCIREPKWCNGSHASPGMTRRVISMLHCV